MFVVVSRWKVHPGKEKEAEVKGRAVRDVIRSLPGVELVAEFINEEVAEAEEIMAVIGYKDRVTYDRLINDPNGSFVKALHDSGLEDITTWIESWRGNTLDA